MKIDLIIACIEEAKKQTKIASEEIGIDKEQIEYGEAIFDCCIACIKEVCKND